MTSQVCRYMITMINRCTSWPEVCPVADISADTVARVVYNGWISRFGCMDIFATDQGRQFESALFRSLIGFLGVTRIRSSPCHLEVNSKIERFHRSFKSALMAR